MGKKGVVLTIGVFDGFHRGHQALVRKTMEWARRLKAVPSALTFRNHPLHVLRHPGKVSFLYPREETARCLKEAGLKNVAVVSFTLRFAHLTPEEFVQWLLKRYELKAVVVGANFRFGTGNLGNVKTLKRLGRRYGFKVMAVSLRGGDRNAVSSTRIRQALQAGRMKVANRMLGRPFHISGRVAPGRHVGHRLGFPTANLRSLKCFIPREGIYACLVRVGKKTYRGGLDLGVQPTLAAKDPRLCAEVHLLGFRGNLYGRRIVVHLFQYLRPEVRFKNLEQLKRQIRKDIDRISRMPLPQRFA